MTRSRHKRTAFQAEGQQIFVAQRAAERLLARAQTERTAVLSLSRDELATLARHMADVSQIAERYHLAQAHADD